MHALHFQNGVFQIKSSKVQLLSSYPGPKSMAEWTLIGKVWGGRGVSRPLPPTAGFNVPLRGPLHPFIQLAY